MHRIFLCIAALLMISGDVCSQPVQARTMRDELRSLLDLMGPGWEQEEAIKCGLPYITAALENRAALSAAQQAALGRLLVREERQKSFVNGHFKIHYDTSGNHAPALLDALYQPIPGSANAFADSVASIANQVWAVEVGELGYSAPPQDQGQGGGPEYDIYIKNLGALYGQTEPEIPLDGGVAGGRWITFLTIDNDFIFVSPARNRGLPAVRVTLAHEFHHAIQLGTYGYWTSEIYFYELSSTWMEDVVFPAVNDYYNYIAASWGHFRNPDQSFISNNLIMYSRGIWGHFVAKRFGVDAMRRCWEQVRSVPPLRAMDGVLQTQYGSSMRSAFAEWTLWNYYTGYRSDTARFYADGNEYPLVLQTPIGFTPPSGQASGDLEPLAARYYQVMSAHDSLALALSNLNVSLALSGSVSKSPYVYLLNDSQVDEFYKPTSVGIFVKLDVSDPTNWWSWDIVRGTVGTGGYAEGLPFPNPFYADGSALLHFVLAARQGTRGTLRVYTSNMDMVHESEQEAEARLGKTVFSWNGRTVRGDLAPSGIYLFVISLPDHTMQGKIALVRR